MKKNLFLLFVYGVPLSYAMEPEQSIKSIKVGIFSDQNNRKSQEDRFYHSAIEGGNLCAVYDGRFGAEVSDFLAKNFHKYFSQTSGSMYERMTQAFCNVDNDEEVKRNKHCGAAAAIVFIKDNVAHCAHVGDARVVLESEGNVAFFTKDHKLNRADEYVRIEDKKGAQFVDMMKNHDIVSRSVGDHGFNKDILISEPDYEEIELTQQPYKFLILATDGLWSVATNEEVVEKLHAEQSQEQDVNKLAQKLVDFAVEKKSKDNITVMLVNLLS